MDGEALGLFHGGLDPFAYFAVWRGISYNPFLIFQERFWQSIKVFSSAKRSPFFLLLN